MNAPYDRIGKNYSVQRCTDPIIAAQLYSELNGASKILNIGAGTGSYEPSGVDLIALEPSSEMIAQRPSGAHPVVQGVAENLPFEDNLFSHTLTVLSMHHWTDRAKAFKEITRVTREKFVAISWDPALNSFWLTRDYFPEIYELDKLIFPPTTEFARFFNEVKIAPLMIPANCQDGFLGAYWKRPKAYLQTAVRQTISTFSKIGSEPGLQKLSQDLEDGTWEATNRDILDLESLDIGYVVISGHIKS